jgi:hypothetical protein
VVEAGEGRAVRGREGRGGDGRGGEGRGREGRGRADGEARVPGPTPQKVPLHSRLSTAKPEDISARGLWRQASRSADYLWLPALRHDHLAWSRPQWRSPERAPDARRRDTPCGPTSRRQPPRGAFISTTGSLVNGSGVEHLAAADSRLPLGRAEVRRRPRSWLPGA